MKDGGSGACCEWCAAPGARKKPIFLLWIFIKKSPIYGCEFADLLCKWGAFLSTLVGDMLLPSGGKPRLTVGIQNLGTVKLR